MPWFALYTESRHEKKVAEKLTKLGIEVYCPLVTQIKQWSDRKKKVEVPLIPSYVFVKLEESERNVVFEVSGVVRYLYWLGKAAIVKEEEITLLKNWLSGSSISSFEIKGIAIGDSYKIESGPFTGKEGIVTTIDKNYLSLVLPQLGFKIILNK
ncbi:UpxY family transcription antiterminator [Flavobacterium sp.]